ncbi:EAL domain-containing protein [Mesorhizobium sp. Cs1299R1N3]|uniref:EAL domain-containing protein n=1 Tax=Mesorhizobium sp. Cs1299R1N3 TaxID=3015173 RepID=UPI003FA5B5FF
MRDLRRMGIRIAPDDFGSGYCCVRYLRQFTIDKIKVDKTIVDDVARAKRR